jgi:hypothetical protein
MTFVQGAAGEISLTVLSFWLSLRLTCFQFVAHSE